LILTTVYSQQKSAAVKITYLRSSNGALIENQDPIMVYSSKNKTLISSEKIATKTAAFPFEFYYFEREKMKWHQAAMLKEGKVISTIDSTSIANQKFELGTSSKKILGYVCRNAKTVINSNTIELWFTTEAGFKGAPTILGQDLGLVLELTRNNNYSITAQKIEKLKNFPAVALQFSNEKASLDLLSYRDELWKSRFTRISIFENEIINFSNQSKSNDSILRFANGTVIARKIKVGQLSKGTKLFIDLETQSNGDAYDRTGSVFLIPMQSEITFLDALQKGANILPLYENGNGKKYQGVAKTGNYTPLVELLRFFTPFGVGHFNYLKIKNKEWESSVFYRQEISDLHTLFDNQEILVGIFIGNYDKGGHKVSLNVTLHKEEKSDELHKKVIPLFNTLNVMEMAGQEYGTMFNSEKGLEVTFTLTTDLKNAQLRYITTGHGGWENGDEFLPKKNTVFLDEKEAFVFVPWKTDCGSYRNYNPASGNFENGLSSSDYSRSNWCPGTTTNPIFIELGNLKAGKHTMTIKIPQGENEGNSFSAWNVSGVLLGE